MPESKPDREGPPPAPDWTACPRCGYDLAGLPSFRCPECGLTIPARDPRAEHQRLRDHLAHHDLRCTHCRTPLDPIQDGLCPTCGTQYRLQRFRTPPPAAAQGRVPGWLFALLLAGAGCAAWVFGRVLHFW